MWTKGKFGTGEGLLWYGICARCKKQASVVRGAFSEAFGVKNRLLRYGRDIRCQKQPSLVRDAFSKSRRTADPQTVDSLLPTGRISRGVPCQKQPTAAPDASSVRETAPLGGD